MTRSTSIERALVHMIAGIAMLAAPGLSQRGFAQEVNATRLSLGAALDLALRQNPNTLLQQQQVAANQGILLEAQGQFDAVASLASVRTRDLRTLRQDELAAMQAAGVVGVTEQSTNSTTHQVGVDKTLMNGYVLGAGFRMTQVNDSNARLAGLPTQATGRLNFSLKVPLLRNAGREAVGARVASSEAELSAAILDLLHTNSQTVLSTTLAYWDLCARDRLRDIAVAAEQRSVELVEDTRKLILADEVPAADIELVIASRAEKAVARGAAEQAALDARHALARTLGRASADMAMLPIAGDALPDYDGRKIEVAGQVERLVRSAIDARPDLDAQRKRELAGKLRVAAAANGLKPQLDFSVSISYAGLAEGASAVALDRVFFNGKAGPSGSIGLNLQWPFDNAQARGNLMTQSASLDAIAIRLREREAGVASNVTALAAALDRSAQQLTDSREAVKRYAAALQNQLTRRRLGSATLLDVISIEDRLTNALLNQVQLQLAYANAIANLRFEVGGLVRKQDVGYDVQIADLLSPDFSPRR